MNYYYFSFQKDQVARLKIYGAKTECNADLKNAVLKGKNRRYLLKLFIYSP